MHLYTALARHLRHVKTDPVIINFDLMLRSPGEVAQVNAKIRLAGGLILDCSPVGPGQHWKSWTVKFLGRQAAEDFLRAHGLMGLEKYEVKR